MIKRTTICRSLEDTLQVLQEQSTASKEIREILALFDILRAQVVQERSKGPFIVVEGLDGSGKSTLCSTLSERLKGVLLSTPSAAFKPCRNYFELQPEKMKRAFYGLTNYAVACEVSRVVEDKPIILDRYWHSTAAYSLASQKDDLPPIGSKMYSWPKDLLCPDIIIFLHVTEEERLRRHKGRGTTNTEEEQRLEKDEGFREKLIDVYQRFYCPSVTIVDGSGDKNLVLQNVLKVLKDAALID